MAQLPLLDVDDRGKCHRERDLHDDDRRPDAAELQSASPGRGLLQPRSHTARHLERGHHAGDRGAEHGEPEREQHRCGREAHVVPEGEAAEIHFEEGQSPVLQRDMGGRETNDRGHAAEDERLRKHLRNDPAAAGAQRRAHGELALARRGAREEKQRDVAADQDEERHGEEIDRRA